MNSSKKKAPPTSPTEDGLNPSFGAIAIAHKQKSSDFLLKVVFEQNARVMRFPAYTTLLNAKREILTKFHIPNPEQFSLYLPFSGIYLDQLHRTLKSYCLTHTDTLTVIKRKVPKRSVYVSIDLKEEEEVQIWKYTTGLGLIQLLEKKDPKMISDYCLINSETNENFLPAEVLPAKMTQILYLKKSCIQILDGSNDSGDNNKFAWEKKKVPSKNSLNSSTIKLGKTKSSPHRAPIRSWSEAKIPRKKKCLENHQEKLDTNPTFPENNSEKTSKDLTYPKQIPENMEIPVFSLNLMDEIRTKSDSSIPEIPPRKKTRTGELLEDGKNRPYDLLHRALLMEFSTKYSVRCPPEECFETSIPEEIVSGNGENDKTPTFESPMKSFSKISFRRKSTRIYSFDDPKNRSGGNSGIVRVLQVDSIKQGEKSEILEKSLENRKIDNDSGITISDTESGKSSESLEGNFEKITGTLSMKKSRNKTRTSLTKKISWKQNDALVEKTSPISLEKNQPKSEINNTDMMNDRSSNGAVCMDSSTPKN